MLSWRRCLQSVVRDLMENDQGRERYQRLTVERRPGIEANSMLEGHVNMSPLPAE